MEFSNIQYYFLSFKYPYMTFKILKTKGKFADGVSSCALAETEIPQKVQQEIPPKNHEFVPGMGRD